MRSISCFSELLICCIIFPLGKQDFKAETNGNGRQYYR